MEQEKTLGGVWKSGLIFLTVVGLILTINQVFGLRFFNITLLDLSYLYFLIAVFLPYNFILYPKNRSVAWYDLVFAFSSFAIGIYFGINGRTITTNSWELVGPLLPTILSIVLWFLVLEAVRRTSGNMLAIICLIFSVFPLFAGYMPGFLEGVQFSFLELARMHAISRDSIVGMPADMFGRLLIGFMVFGVVLKNTGGGKFFLDLALAFFGKHSGGPAKVAVVSSSLMGTLSGSIISNVVTTGAITIPSMKKAGYSNHYAGAIEATASTGGMIMPPIMGAAAFIMAAFLGVPYTTIIGAAIIPAILYFWCIFVQVDAYAGKNGLKGLPRPDLPSRWKTLKEGWHFIFAFVLLFYLLFGLRVEAWAPFYTALALILLSYFRKETRMNGKKLVALIEEIGSVLTMLMSLMLSVGLILGALTVTGVALSFSREIVVLIGHNSLLILIAGAITSFILGMGMTATTCYIFLAIVMAPALVTMGYNAIAAHMFIFYWGMLSYLTPPVALAVYAASGIANSPPMKTGWTAVRMGIVAFIIPFYFIYNPALLAQDNALNIAIALVTGMIGVWLLASGMEGYVRGVGNIPNLAFRFIFVIIGLCVLTSNLYLSTLGIIAAIAILILIRKMNLSKKMDELHYSV